MRPREQRETGEQDLFRLRLDQIIDMIHRLVKLARSVVGDFWKRSLERSIKDGPGRPPLPTRLMAGLAILKHTFNLSDEVLCKLWLENPYYQYLCGEEFFQHELPFERSLMSVWRNRMGEERLQAPLRESLAAATRSGAMKPSDLSRVSVDTTVQPKNVTFPTDAKLVNRACEKLVKLANRLGVDLCQSYVRVGKMVLIRHQRYAHARQSNRAKRALRNSRPISAASSATSPTRSQAITGSKPNSLGCSISPAGCASIATHIIEWAAGLVDGRERKVRDVLMLLNANAH